MDGSFVRFGIYPEFLMRLSDISKCNLILHLMTKDILFSIDQFIHIKNVNYISFHIDNNISENLRYIDKIKDNKIKCGVVIIIYSSLIDPLIQSQGVDYLVFMGIHPGVLKQSHKSYLVLNKLNELNKLEYDFEFIQCDGGVTFDTIHDLTRLGINNLVCGSSTLFKDVFLIMINKDMKKLTLTIKKF